MKIPYQIIVFLYGAIVFWALNVPQTPKEPIPIPYPTESAHLVLFAGMAAVITLGIFRSHERISIHIFFWVPLVASSAYGFFIEILQIWVPLRSFQWSDGALDMVGSLLAQTILWAWLRRSPRLQRPS